MSWHDLGCFHFLHVEYRWHGHVSTTIVDWSRSKLFPLLVDLCYRSRYIARFVVHGVLCPWCITTAADTCKENENVRYVWYWCDHVQGYYHRSGSREKRPSKMLIEISRIWNECDNCAVWQRIDKMGSSNLLHDMRRVWRESNHSLRQIAKLYHIALWFSEIRYYWKNEGSELLNQKLEINSIRFEVQCIT